MDKTIILYKQNDKLIVCRSVDNVFDEKYFDYNNSLDLIGNIVAVFDNDEFTLKNKQIFIIDRSTVSLKYRKDIAEVFFELLGIAAFYITSQSMLALHDNNLESGIVIDCCDNKLYSIPIYDEKIIKTASSQIKFSSVKNIKKIIERRISATIKKCKIDLQDSINENIVFSTTVPKAILDNIDDLSGDIVYGDPINGAKKMIHILNDNNIWITKQKYKEKGSCIIEKKCFS